MSDDKKQARHARVVEKAQELIHAGAPDPHEATIALVGIRDAYTLFGEWDENWEEARLAAALRIAERETL